MKLIVSVILSAILFGADPSPISAQVEHAASGITPSSAPSQKHKMRKHSAHPGETTSTGAKGAPAAASGPEATTMPIGHVPKCCKPKDQSDNQ